MARNPHLSAAAASGAVASIGARVDGGYLRVYDGTQPDGVADSITTQVLLVEFRFAGLAFGAPVDGVAALE